MITSRIKWWSGLRRKRGTLSLTNRLTLTEETGKVIFDVPVTELRKVKIQMDHMYVILGLKLDGKIKLGRRFYSLSLSPEVKHRKAQDGTEKNEIQTIDQLTAEWKQALQDSGIRRVSRIPAWILLFLVILYLVINKGSRIWELLTRV